MSCKSFNKKQMPCFTEIYLSKFADTEYTPTKNQRKRNSNQKSHYKHHNLLIPNQHPVELFLDHLIQANQGNTIQLNTAAEASLRRLLHYKEVILHNGLLAETVIHTSYCRLTPHEKQIADGGTEEISAAIARLDKLLLKESGQK